MEVHSDDLDYEVQNDEDPFSFMGYGVNAYFDFLRSLANLFFMMTVFSIPLFIIYS